MKLTTLIRGICLLLLAPLLATCSSGGEGGTGVTADKPIITKGAITGLGSVVVNNVHYDASPTAVIIINGNKASDTDLKVGMVAAIKGTLLANGRGSADEIVVDDVVIGAVDQTPATNTDTILRVMGQQIEINTATQLIGITNLPDDLTIGTTVSVSGLIKGSGIIAATRIEKINSTQIDPNTFVYLTKGFLSGLNKEKETFEIGDLTVDYKNVHFDEPNNNTVVTVTGVAENYKITGAGNKKTFAAQAINIAKFSEIDADNAEIEGYITSIPEPSPAACAQSGFYLNELLVCISTTTRFERGTAADILPTIKVRVEGEYSSLGVLQATEVEFEGE